MCSGITAMIRSGCGRCSYRNTTENIKSRNNGVVLRFHGFAPVCAEQTRQHQNNKNTEKTTKKQKKMWFFIFRYAIMRI